MANPPISETIMAIIGTFIVKKTKSRTNKRI